MAEELVLYEVSDGVATVTLNDPEKRNRLSQEMLTQLVAAIRRAGGDSDARAVVLTGAGKAFCAGADLGGFGSDAPPIAKHFGTDLFLEYFRLMPRLGKPTLCAANGHVVAGGMGLALSCDLVIAKEGADFWTPEINIGAVPVHDHGAHLPKRPAQEGQRDDAARRARAGDDALAYGLANKVVPEDEFDDAVADWAGRLASKSPVLMRLGHDAMYRQQDMALDDALEYLRSQLSLTFTTEDIVEGAHGVLREARAELEGALMATKETKAAEEAEKVAKAAKEAEAPEAPAEVEAGEQTGMKALVEDLHGRREKAKLGGGEEKIALQHERGKLTARERIDLLVDPGTFVELGIQAGPHSSQRSMEGKEAPADGVITGWGDVEGRTCCIAAYDFTVMAGSMGMTGEFKVGRLREMALQKRMPLIWLLDSAGARIQEAAGSMFAGSGHLFREEVTMSGVIPLVAAMLGPVRGGHRVHPRPVGLRADGRRAGRDGARRARTSRRR